jgi:hypothetical protein
VAVITVGSYCAITPQNMHLHENAYDVVCLPYVNVNMFGLLSTPVVLLVYVTVLFEMQEIKAYSFESDEKFENDQKLGLLK